MNEGGDESGTAALLDDWVTIWRSEMAAMVVDRELQEAAVRMIDAWAAQAQVAARMAGHAIDAASGHAGAGAAAGAAAAGAAPDGRDAVIAQLLARVAELGAAGRRRSTGG